LSWCRRIRISASSRALDRNSLVSAHARQLEKIDHREQPLPDSRLLASRMSFPVGTGVDPATRKRVIHRRNLYFAQID
jgi:hypothetical protein